MPNLKKTILKYLPIHHFKSYRSYSQDGEDMILKAFYESRKNYKGFYVDIGAHHPVRYSNTYYFYKKGWRGINVEPTPTSLKAFRLLRGRDINLNLGVAAESGSLDFYCFNEPALNTFSKEASINASKSEKYTIIKKLQVHVMPLNDILDRYLPRGTRIDFLSVDVEGLDLEVLKSNDWNRFKPDYLLVEGHVEIDQISQDDIYLYLRAIGYKLVSKTMRTLIFSIA